jgi:hypothetical protein
VPNIAWQSYLQLDLGYSSWILGLLSIIGSIMTLVGILVYKYFFFHISWRMIYMITAAIKVLFQLCNLILIFQWNEKYLNLSNYLFSVGDDIIKKYVTGDIFSVL